jgi:hypothetical protein
LKLSYHRAKLTVEETSMFWVAMLAALVLGIYEFLSGPTVLG